MGRAPCCEKIGLKKGRWTAEEDEILMKYIQHNGEGSWRSLPKNAGLLRCGKSCRLRWLNYLRTDLRRGNISSEEENLIIKLHSSLGNRWSLIAGHLPGRTDNEIKNYWNSHLSRRIDTFRRPSNEASAAAAASLPITIMNIAKMNDGCKRKGGRTSRAAMKKNNNINHHSNNQSNVKSIMPTILDTTTPGIIQIAASHEVVSMTTQQQEKIKNNNNNGTTTLNVERRQTMSTLLQDPYLDGNVVFCSSSSSTSDENDGPMMSSSLELGSKDEQEVSENRVLSNLLGPNEGLETQIMCHPPPTQYDMMGDAVVVDSNGLLTFTDDHTDHQNVGFMCFNEERDCGVLANSDINITTSCFEDEWVGAADWDWVGVVGGHHHNNLLWEDDCEQMLSWLEH